MKIRVGILTFQRANNYGAILQNIAMIRAINSVYPLADVRTIDYRDARIEDAYQFSNLRIGKKITRQSLKQFIKNVFFLRRYRLLNRNFNEIRSRYLRMTDSLGINELTAKKAIFDFYIAGSDQIWNSKITGTDDDSVFTLGFTENAVRISYAASAGSNAMLGTGTMKQIAKLDRISVREESLREYLSSRLNREVRTDVDPVFLIEREDWVRFLPPEKIAKGKYVFAYCVSERINEVVKIAREIAKKRKYRILYVDQSLRYGIGAGCRFGAGPKDFLRYIRDAEAIVTSSFHATAFSVIFQKEFVVVPSRETGDRITNLLKNIGMEKNAVDSYADYMADPTPARYERSDAYLRSARENSLRYLESSIRSVQEQGSHSAEAR